ncbi:MAG: hypothetical protein MI753_18365 [Hyphomicrobiales bacterium]|nr:hypothetical protein [Hyphomicrobiales bacterium]
MMPVIDPDPSLEKNDEGTVRAHYWEMLPDEELLESFLKDIFENHWQGIVFGPLIEGAAYEWKCPSRPKKVALFDGYLTVHFGTGGHFHLCIGENKGSESHPTPEDLKKRRRPSRARIFRKLDPEGAPISWGFEMVNGADEPMIAIFFPSPFLTDDDQIADEPDFSRLAIWRSVARTWLGREVEVIDETGKGFAAFKR